MNYSLAVAQSFDNAAAHYDKHALLQQQVLARIAELLPHPEAGHSILDAGCGTGYITQFFPVDTYTMHGVDIAPAMVVEARGKGMDAQQADVVSLPYEDDYFDNVVSSLCLQWVELSEHAIAEMVRVLKPGGYGVIAVMADQTLSQLRNSFTAFDKNPHMLDFLSITEYRAMVEKHSVGIIYCLPEMHIQHYGTVKDIARGLKAIGANNKNPKRAKGLMTPRQWHNLEALYKERYGVSQGLPVHWEIAYILFQKA